MKKTSRRSQGRNMFGEPCVEKILTLNKETAIEQYMEMLKDVHTSNVRVEYTVDYRCFTPEEAKAFSERAKQMHLLFAKIYNRSFNEYQCRAF